MNGGDIMRIMVTITSAHPSILESLNSIPPRDRAEFMRTMALVGILFCRRRDVIGSDTAKSPEAGHDTMALRRDMMRRGLASLV